MNQRLTVYRRMAAVRTDDELDRLMDELRDRYGPPPDSVLNLAEYAVDPALADRIGLESLDREGQIVVLKFRPDAKLDPAWLFRVVQERGDLDLLPPATLKLDLRRRPIAAGPAPPPPRRRNGQGRAAIRWPAAPGGRPGPRPARSRRGSPGTRSWAGQGGPAGRRRACSAGSAACSAQLSDSGRSAKILCFRI